MLPCVQPQICTISPYVKVEFFRPIFKASINFGTDFYLNNILVGLNILHTCDRYVRHDH